MKMKLCLVFLLSMVLITAGCGRESALQPFAGLEPQDVEALGNWHMPDNLRQQGEGNVYRAVAGEGWNKEPMLELAAGGSGSMEYFIDGTAGPAALAQFKLLFLSTQGVGRIKLSSLDDGGAVVQTVGWVVTGQVPGGSADDTWIDVRSSANYKGSWMEASYAVEDVLEQELQAVKPASSYRLSVEVGEGQHVLVQKLHMTADKGRAVKLTAGAALTARIGDTAAITVEVENRSQEAQDAVVKLLEPYGYGVVALDGTVRPVSLAPGEKIPVSWNVKAQRPDAVNMNQAWSVRFSVNDVTVPEAVSVSVNDTRPGKIFYVMTEDLEAIDSAGYPAGWGNKNGWLDPEEVFVQMVQKPRTLDAIAEQYGAKWTHYIAWPIIKAAEWAAARSATGKWPEVIAAVRQSVSTETEKGHEYGIHMHADYDPYLPGNVLSYNQPTDGFWANHLRHGWAHSITGEGNFDDYASRTGSLYAYKRILDELTAAAPEGPSITARAGSFDFGSGSADEAASTAAYRRVGLWGTSDADGNNGGITAGDYGHEIYLSAPDNINKPAEAADNSGLVEFRPTPRQFINYDRQTAEDMNSKADQGMAYFTVDGKIKPGVHSIAGFTHAMFVLGDGGWQSLGGGSFTQLDHHLLYLKQRYVDQGQLRFATASELVKAYLDYYTPVPVAVYGRRLKHTGWFDEFAIDILGSDIPIDAGHPHTVEVKYPLYYHNSAYHIVILKDDQPVYSTWGLPTPFNDIRFLIDDGQARYTLKVYHNDMLFRMMTGLKKWK